MWESLMALIKCPECNHDISDKAVTCLACGFPMETLEEEKVIYKTGQYIIKQDKFCMEKVFEDYFSNIIVYYKSSSPEFLNKYWIVINAESLKRPLSLPYTEEQKADVEKVFELLLEKCKSDIKYSLREAQNAFTNNQKKHMVLQKNKIKDQEKNDYHKSNAQNAKVRIYNIWAQKISVGEKRKLKQQPV